MAGKGSKPRPYSVPRETFDDNWDRIFGKKQPEDTETQEVEQAENTTENNK